MVDLEQMLDDVWEVIEAWECQLEGASGEIWRTADQERLDDAKGAMAVIRECLELPPEVEVQPSNAQQPGVQY